MIIYNAVLEVINMAELNELNIKLGHLLKKNILCINQKNGKFLN